jgi:glycosyltransferase involved in cell wall biosynthesis
MAEILGSKRVTLVNTGYPLGSFGDLQIQNLKKLSGFVPLPGSTVVCPASSLLGLAPENLRTCRVICVSHHPHDESLIGLSRRFNLETIVSVGQYAHHSNRQIAGGHHRYIPGLFWPETSGNRLAGSRKPNDARLVGHISSLHPAKGFLDVARAWAKITRLVPGATLEVIGDLSLYGDHDRHPFLPMDVEQGNLVEKALGESLRTVRFLGRQDNGVDHITARWDLAILNPRGLSEADPGSFKDMLRTGVPTLAGYDYGLMDYLQFFPELRIRKPEDLPVLAMRLLANPSLLERLSRDFLELSSELRERNSGILNAWTKLVGLPPRPVNHALESPRELAIKKKRLGWEAMVRISLRSCRRKYFSPLKKWAGRAKHIVRIVFRMGDQ